MKLNKKTLLIIAAATYCCCLLISNVTAGKTFGVGMFTLPCAVLLFPVVYILNDMLTEVFGYKTARGVVLMGFALNLVAVGMYALTIVLPGSEFFAGQEAYETVLGSTPRLLAASMTAYLVGSLANAKIMEAMKKISEHRLMFRCVTSTLVGETLDACLFIGIAFAGTMPLNALLGMIVAQATFKTIYEVAVYPITRKVIMAARNLPESEV